MEKEEMINEEVLNLFKHKKKLKKFISLKKKGKKKRQEKYIKTKRSKYSVKKYLLVSLSLIFIFIIVLSFMIFTFIFNKDISKRKDNNLYKYKSETKVGLCII